MIHRAIHYLTASDRDVDWGLYATGCGHSQYEAEDPYPSTVHGKDYFKENWHKGRILNEIQLVYIHQGQGRLYAKQDSLRIEEEVKAGHLFLLRPGVWHTYHPSPQTGWEEYWVGMRGDWTDRWLEKNLIPRSKVLFRNVNTKTCHALFDTFIDTASSSNSNLQALLRPQCIALLETLMCREEQQQTISHFTLIEKVKEEFDRSYKKQVSVEAYLDKVLRECNSTEIISYSYFRKLFTQNYGLTPGQYLDQLRLTEAKKLLHLGEKSIQEISKELGFHSPFYFSNFFKKKQGISPKYYGS